MAISSAQNFTVQNNFLVGNTTFIGSRGPNCSTTEPTPPPEAFIIDWSLVTESSIQSDFQNTTDGDGLTCILPPDGGDYWPFGGNPNPVPGEPVAPGSPTPSPTNKPGSAQTSTSGGLSGGAKAGIALAVIFGLLFIAVLTWFIRRKTLASLAARRESRASRLEYSRNMAQISSSG